jgi:hypothetical protein
MRHMLRSILVLSFVILLAPSPFAGTIKQTTTTLTSNPNPSNYGETVFFVAMVTPTPAGGSVEFTYPGGQTQVPLSGNSAYLYLSSLPVGSDSISAQFLGYNNGIEIWLPSTGTLIQQVK